MPKHASAQVMTVPVCEVNALHRTLSTWPPKSAGVRDPVRKEEVTGRFSCATCVGSGSAVCKLLKDFIVVSRQFRPNSTDSIVSV